MEQVCLKGYRCSEPANPVECENGTYNDLENQEEVKFSKDLIIAIRKTIPNCVHLYVCYALCSV